VNIVKRVEKAVRSYTIVCRLRPYQRS
jgi:hypothetical protein